MRYIHVKHLIRTTVGGNKFKYEIYTYKILKIVHINPAIINLGIHIITVPVSRG